MVDGLAETGAEMRVGWSSTLPLPSARRAREDWEVLGRGQQTARVPACALGRCRQRSAAVVLRARRDQTGGGEDGGAVVRWQAGSVS